MLKHVIFTLFALLLSVPTFAQLSLQAYRDSVYVNSDEIAIAEERVSKAFSESKKSYTQFLPNISANASLHKTLRRVGQEKLWGFSLTPQLSQTLLGGGVRAGYQQSQSRYGASSYAAEYVRMQIRYQADYAYWSLSAMGLYRDAMAEYLSIINSLARIVRERFNEGYVAKGDLLQVEARRSEAEFAMIESQNNYDVALHLFNNLRGVDQSSDVLLAESIIDSMAMPIRVDYYEILDRRADLRSAELSIRSAELGVDIAQAAFNPKLQLSVGGSWQTFTPNASNKTYIDGAITLGVSVPIFHWGERRHTVALARSDVQIAYREWQQIRDDIEQQEADGWSALRSSYLQMQSSLRNLEIASENLAISTFAYNEGQATVLDVLQAQISWIQIYTNAITARFNYAVAVSAYQFITSSD